MGRVKSKDGTTRSWHIKKRITIADIYRFYPYKCRDLTSNTTPMNPYIPKEEVICDHKYSLTKKEWKKIILCYLKYLTLYLFKGFSYKLPSKLGSLQIRKYKGKTTDWVATRKVGKRVYYDNEYLQNYRTKLFWDRSHAILKYKYYWRYKPTRKYLDRYSDYINSDPFRINNFNTNT